MSEFKIKNCKKLTLRKDLCDESAVLYLTKKDRFHVDTSKVYYDFQNTPMYKAKLYYGKEGNWNAQRYNSKWKSNKWR